MPTRLRLVHLFPDVLRFYGDGGNVNTLVARANARSIDLTVIPVPVGAQTIPAADIVFVGGGQDAEQVTVARELERLGLQLTDLVAQGTALLAVCGGFQNLGRSYRTSAGTELPCPGLLPVTTDAVAVGPRLVGPVVAHLAAELPAELPAMPARTVVGFENHGGRTSLDPGARAFATIEIGHGNDGRDHTEGVLLLPGEGGLRGLRIGTYLHGPLLPRNPHIADAVLAAAVAGGTGFAELAPLDDRFEWEAHEHAVERIRRSTDDDRLRPGWVRRIVDPIRSLIGY